MGESNQRPEWNGEPHEPTMVSLEQPNKELVDLEQDINGGDDDDRSMYDPGMPMGGPMPPAAPILVTPPGGGPPRAMMIPPGGGPLVPYAPV